MPDDMRREDDEIGRAAEEDVIGADDEFEDDEDVEEDAQGEDEESER